MSGINKMMKLNIGMCVALAMASSNLYAANLNADSWTQGDVNGCVVNTSGGSASVSFSDTSSSFLSALSGATVLAASSTSTFAGDYTAAGAQSVNFALAADVALSVDTRVVLEAANGTIWVNNKLVIGANSIGFGSEDGWRVELRASRAEATLVEDMGDLVSLGIRVFQNETSAQTVTVSGFALTSDAPIGSTALEAALYARFGVSTADEVTDTSDGDGDGLSDLNEILAEHDDDNSFMAANLSVEIVGVDSNGAELRWVHVKDKTYSVLKADQVGGSFSVVDSVTAPDTGKNEWPYVDATAIDDKGFYLIRQE